MKIIERFGRLELIAFVSGFFLMAFELIGARMLAPGIGSSTYVWTSVIGVIIAALSVGYFTGGKLADMRHQPSDIAVLCLAIAMAVGCMLLLFDSSMSWILHMEIDSRLKGVLASLLLFAPTSFLLGVLSPYLVKLKVTSLEVSGQSVASLSACNSIGGIAGTFVTGFIVFSYIGSREALLLIVILMVAISWLLVPRKWLKARIGVTCVAIGIVALPLLAKNDFVRIDTPSAHYEVRTGYVGDETRPLRYLTSGPYGVQSGIYIDQPGQLAFWYTKEIVRITELAPTKQRMLILGGGAFTMPEYLARAYPGSTIDVVEIDPQLREVATEYFDYQQLPNVRVIDDDARVYVNTTTHQYDVVIVDVYSDSSVPFSLMTKEYAARLDAITTPSSTILVNAIAAQTGSCRQLLNAVDSAYRVAAPYAAISQPSRAGGGRTNLILAYAKESRVLAGTTPLPAANGPLYDDNFMPAEHLQQLCHAAESRA